MELPRALSSSSFTDSPFSDNQERLEDGGSRHKRDISIQVLEKFSLVTRFARETTSQLFRENLFDDIGTNENKKNNQERPHEIASNEAPIPSDPFEVTLTSIS